MQPQLSSFNCQNAESKVVSKPKSYTFIQVSKEVTIWKVQCGLNSFPMPVFSAGYVVKKNLTIKNQNKQCDASFLTLHNKMRLFSNI